MSTTMKLYEAREALDVIEAWLAEHDEDIAANEGVVPDALAQLIEQAEGDFKAKVERVGLVVLGRAASAKAIKEEAARLTTRAKSLERQADALKSYLKFNLASVGMKKVDGLLCSVRLQANPPSMTSAVGQAALILLAESDEGRRFVREIPATYDIDREAVLTEYKAAIEVVGKGPEPGSPEYDAAYQDWSLRVHAEMQRRGVPEGITVDRGFHVRVS